MGGMGGDRMTIGEAQDILEGNFDGAERDDDGTLTASVEALEATAREVLGYR